MANTLWELLCDNPSQACRLFQEKTGWGCAQTEGSMTRADPSLMKQYKDIYEGHEVNVESHVKNGNKESDPKFIRVYFGFAPEVSNKIIISSIGKHIENYSSQKIH